MQFNWIDTVVLVVYMVGITWLGIYQAKKIKNTGDFFAGGRSFNKFLMMMHSLGTGTHADDPVGVVGAAFKNGISGIWYTFVYLFVTPFYWLMAPLFRRSRFLTTADFFEARFGSKLGTLYAVMGIVIFSVNMGTLLKGTGLIVNAVTQGAVPEMWAILGMTIVFLIYGTAGGLIATVVTETVQGLLIVVMSLLLIPFGLKMVGGFSGLHQVVSDPQMFALTGKLELSFWWIAAGFVANLIGIVAQPHTMEVCSTGKTEFEGRIGFTYGNFIKRLCAIGWAFAGVIMVGLVAKGVVSGSDLEATREAAFGTAIRCLLPAGFTGLMFAAILAAQMSTLSAFMVAASALVSRNIYMKQINPAADEKQMLKVARVAGLVIVALGVIFAYKIQGVADALGWFWSLSALTGLFMWFGVLWRKTNATGAWASFIVMMVIWAIVGQPGAALKPLLPGVSFLGIYGDKTLLHYLLLCYLPAGIIALVIGSYLGKPHPKEDLDKFYALLNTPVGREKELVEQGVEVIYAGASKGHPWEMNHSKRVDVIGFIIALIISGLFFVLLYGLTRIGA